MKALVGKTVLFLPVAFAILWWAYSMDATVHGGARTYSQAVRLTASMACLTTALALIVWVLAPSLHKRSTRISLALKSAGETMVVLGFYTVTVLVWRESWTPARGLTDDAAFMPIVGHVNATFFSEFLWLEYLVVVIPLVSLFSGILVYLFGEPYIRRLLEQPASSHE